MTSKLAAAVLLFLVAGSLVSCSTAGDRGTSEADWAVAVESRTDVKGDLAALCREVLGYEYPEEQLSSWQGQSSRAYAVSVKGHHGPISVRFTIEDGKIVMGEVLKSREQRGKAIKTKRFLRQFFGSELSGQGELSGQIEGITGATKSSKAVMDAARLALRLAAEDEKSGAAGGRP